MTLKYLFLILLFSPLCVLSQGGENELEEVIIRPKRDSSLTKITLTNAQISRKSPNDLADLAVVFPGVQIRSYGDVGALKTINTRSLGSSHTQLIIDGTTQFSSSTGSVDFGAQNALFVSEVSLVHAASLDLNTPVVAKFASASLQVKTFHQQKNTHFGVQLSSLLGSFNHQQFAGFIRIPIKQKWQHTFSFLQHNYEGKYPFSYLNGNTLVKETRHPSEMKETQGQWGQLFSFNKVRISWINKFSTSSKELPGAVVFYNPFNNQYLKNKNISSSAEIHFNHKKSNSVARISFAHQQLDYIDSSYLNTQGYLHQSYKNQDIYSEYQLSKTWSSKFKGLLGGSFTQNTLQSDAFSSNVNRKTFDVLSSVEYGKKQKITLQTGMRYSIDKAKDSLRTFFQVPILVSFRTKFLKKYFFQSTAKQTFRMPSFNELYYQQIGNSYLLPEKALIFDLNLEREWSFNNSIFSIIIGGFINQVSNKIIAIPNKNSFVWSILNVGKTQAQGIELQTKIDYSLTKKAVLSWNTNYTFSNTVDISDKKESSYKQLLAYSPQHSGFSELNFTHSQFSIFTQIQFIGSRYTLNENIAQNLLSPYFSIDLGSNYSFVLKKHSVKIQGKINNLSNQNNQYIRYFILPGRNVQLQVIYRF